MSNDPHAQCGKRYSDILSSADGWGLVNRVAPMPGEGMVPLSILEPFDNPS